MFSSFTTFVGVFVSTNTAFDLQELKKIRARINNPFFIIFFGFL
jgi:hypothetical protein